MVKTGIKKLPGTNNTGQRDKAIFDTGKFTFQNNDTYEGEYKIQYGQLMIVKEGEGVYTTDNFDKYNGRWHDDAYAEDEIHIRYNNNAEFRGNVDSKGTMNGPGTYTFPDGSLLEANWLNNKPFTNIIYREPLGFKWVLESVSENMVSFSPGNHFWDDVIVHQDTSSSTYNETTENI